MAEKKRPNIVWITLDHLVYANHKKQSGYPKMPRFDQLAKEGMVFNNAFSVCPLCQPCRASMLTGQYPHKHGMVMNDGNAGVRLEFDAEDKLFQHHLQDAGYRTGYFGKWHMGEERTAIDYGFEGFSVEGYGHPYWSKEYKDYLAEKSLPEAEVEVEWWVGHPDWQGRSIRLCDFEKPYSAPHLLMEASGKLNNAESHEAYFLAHMAEKWLADRAQDGEAFCMRVDMWGPHHPFWVAEPFLDTVDPKSLEQYPSFGSDLEHRPSHHRKLMDYRKEVSPWREWDEFAWLLARSHEHTALVDDAVGRVIDAISKHGLAENTIVIYTADHGGSLATNGYGIDKGWMMIEETIQVPLAMRWHEHIDAESSCDKFVTNMDIFSTVLEAGSANIPENTDSRSMLQLAQGKSGEWAEDMMLEHHGHYGIAHFQRLIRYKNYKYVAHLDDIEELYDLEADPYEMNNLALGDGHQGVLEDMRQRLYKNMKQYNDDSADASKLLAQIGLQIG